MYGRRKYNKKTGSRHYRHYGRTKSYSSRRTAGKRYRRAGKAIITSRPSWKSPIPQKELFKFVYNDEGYTFDITNANFYTDNWIFRLNSLYDPDESAGGVQPYGYDQTTPRFNYYRVYASKITIYVHNSPQTLRLSIVPLADFITYTGFEDIGRMKGVRQNVLNGTTDESNKMKLSNYSTVKALRPLGTGPDELWAATNANPSTCCYWGVYADGTDLYSSDTTIKFDVKITYYAKMWLINDINES